MDTEIPHNADLPLPDLLRQLATDAALLVRQEIALARVELTEKLTIVASSAVGFGVAAIFALGMFGALTVTVIALVALVLPLWAAALVVTIAYGGIAAVAALLGKNIASRASLVPTQSVESVRADARAVRDGIRRGR